MIINFIILIIILIIIIKINNLENFRLFYQLSPVKRNMSYDLRCEPHIPKQNFPFQNSSIMPYYREKCLNIV